MHEWLSKQADAMAAASGTSRAALELSDSDTHTLLELAKLAAHEGSDRTNAPLPCYLLGVACGGALDVEELAEVVRSTS